MPSTMGNTASNPNRITNNTSPNDPVRLSDVLTRTRAVNTYASLTRDFESSHHRLTDPHKNVTVLAPRNSAVHNLPHKPWENPEEYRALGEVEAYQGQEGRDRARRNLQRFVEGHIVPVSPWREGEEVETLGGKKLRWVKEGDRMVVGVPLGWCILLCANMRCLDPAGQC